MNVKLFSSSKCTFKITLVFALYTLCFSTSFASYREEVNNLRKEVAVLKGIVSLHHQEVVKSNLKEVPAGSVVQFAGKVDALPAGWLLCDGKDLEKRLYPSLFSAIGCTWGCPNEKTFKVPDFRGQFLRGADNGANVDKDARKLAAGSDAKGAGGVGTFQDESFKSHTHTGGKHGHIVNDNGHVHYGIYEDGTNNTMRSGSNVPRGNDYCAPGVYGGDAKTFHTGGTKANVSIAESDPLALNSSGGAETRPINAAVNFIIKY